MFANKPKDAIECIRNGFGDALKRSMVFGFIGSNRVVRFIDRQYGEEIRRKTIEEWKDAKFAYGVKFSYINSFGDGRLVMKDKSLMSWDDDIKDVLSFDNEEDAALFIKEVNEKASKYSEKYNALDRTGDSNWDYEHIYKPFLDSIKGNMNNGENSVYWNAFCGLCEIKGGGKFDYKMEVVQIIKAY